MYKYKSALWLLGASVFIATIINASTVFAAQDQIFLKNGNNISGIVNQTTNTSVTIQTDYGVLIIPSDDISGLSLSRYNISAITPSPAAGQSAATTTNDITAIAPAAGEAAPQTQLWGATWNGTINMGGEVRTGNSDTSAYSVDGETTGKWEKHRLILSANYDREKESDTTTVNEKSGEVTYDYLFSDKWFWENSLKLKQDDIAELDLRTRYTSALGYQFYDLDDLKLKAALGPGYVRESYNNAATTSDVTAQWSLDYEQKFYDDFFRIFHNHELSSPTDKLSDYYFDSESGIRIPIRAGIIASGEVDFERQNTAAAGTDKNDTTYSFKLGYEW